MIDFPDEILKDLKQIDAVSSDLQMKIYVVGGLPRDLVFGYAVDNDTDLDLTEANGNAFDLAFFVSAKYGLMEPEVYESSGTAFVKMASGRDVEFHNAFFNVPHIIDQLYVLGKEPTPLNKDVYSRDFTINTLLMDVDTGEIIDITGKGVHDIENRILRTPLTPKKTLAINPKIILRGIRFKIQFGLTADEEYEKEVMNFTPYLIKFLQENPNSKMVQRTVKKTFEINYEKAIEEYAKYGLTEYLPTVDMPELEKDIKEKMFGQTIIPVASVKKAQTRMMDRLMKEREKHKAYMRRKKRERVQQTKEKFKILDRARSGYYIDNPEPEFVKHRKNDKKQVIWNYIRNSGKSNWFKIAQENGLKTVYHATSQPFDKFDLEKTSDGSVWLTDNLSKAQNKELGASGEGFILECIIDEGSLKLAGWDEEEKYLTQQLINGIQKNDKIEKYDGLKLVEEDETTYRIFDPNNIQIVKTIKAKKNNWLRMAQNSGEVGLDADNGVNINSVNEGISKQENQSVNEWDVFLVEFKKQYEGQVPLEMMDAVVNYVRNTAFNADAIEIAQDSKNISNTLKNPINQLPIGNNEVITDLDNIAEIFGRNVQVFEYFKTFIDSNGNSYKDFIGKEMGQMAII